MWMANHIEHTEVGERSHPFCGQMGKVFFFSEAITATDVQTLHALGPNFLPKKKSEYLRAFCSVANHIGLLTVPWADQLFIHQYVDRDRPQGQRVFHRQQTIRENILRLRPQGNVNSFDNASPRAV